VSAEDLARVVARLQRGWIGVYVTTGTFSRAAQEEMVEDAYPVVLVNGRRLSEELVAMAHDSHGGDVGALLEELTAGAFAEVAHRRPDEILLT
jgi:hypothetical protein